MAEWWLHSGVVLSTATPLGDLTADLATLRSDLLAAEADAAPLLAGLDGDALRSAVNLTHYLAFRAHDVRPLQRALARRGLSSLGRAEGHVLASLDAVLEALAEMRGEHPPVRPSEPLGFDAGRRILRERATSVFGAPPRDRTTRIMVTLPSKAAGDRGLVQAMAAVGMDVARVNLAHDDPEAWAAMIAHVRAVTRPGGAPCRVLVDLPGPKSRTGEVPDDKPLKLAVDDHLTLLRHGEARREPAAIRCTLGLAFERVRPGDRVALDDGKFEGVVEAVAADRIELRLTRAGVGRAKLKAGKGVNFPDTDLAGAALPETDFELLRSVGRDADIVGLSFITRPEDVRAARSVLDRAGGEHVGLLLKIETPQAFERLPELLVAGHATGRPVGVMIARGDLAVEVGVERLAEVQEEVLWLCEAAHLPAVWATQVLEAQAKSGFPSRAEITDAAMGSRAECVMLNKGPRIVDAITTLDSILRRMALHQDKKTPLLRRLTAWD